MASSDEFQETFEKLRNILRKYEKKLVVQNDTADNYYLNSPVLYEGKKVLFFGCVAIKKNYVSYHLMPVYGCPDLIEEMSDELKARMQGKSCFNFTTIGPKLLRELTQITK